MKGAVSDLTASAKALKSKPLPFTPSFSPHPTQFWSCQLPFSDHDKNSQQTKNYWTIGITPSPKGATKRMHSSGTVTLVCWPKHNQELYGAFKQQMPGRMGLAALRAPKEETMKASSIVQMDALELWIIAQISLWPAGLLSVHWEKSGAGSHRNPSAVSIGSLYCQQKTHGFNFLHLKVDTNSISAVMNFLTF